MGRFFWGGGGKHLAKVYIKHPFPNTYRGLTIWYHLTPYWQWWIQHHLTTLPFALNCQVNLILTILMTSWCYLHSDVPSCLANSKFAYWIGNRICMVVVASCYLMTEKYNILSWNIFLAKTHALREAIITAKNKM